MKTSIVIKNVIANIALHSRFIEWKVKNLSRHGGRVILMYHRILPDKKSKPSVQPGMYVTTGTFERQIQYLVSNFNVVRLSEIFSDDKFNIKKSLNFKPRLAVTFDDGWLDNYEQAYPLLKKYDVPATIFLPTSFIGTGKWFWTDLISNLIHYCYTNGTDLIPVNSIPDAVVWRSTLEEVKNEYDKQLETIIDKLKSHSTDSIGKLIQDLSNFHQYDPTPNYRAFINWDEVGEMAESGLIEFGSHSHSHEILTNISIDKIKVELNRSKLEINSHKIPNNKTLAFCYPNGNSNQSIRKAVQKAGYSMAVTTKLGWNFSDGDAFALKRIGIHQDVTSTKALFASRIANIF